MNKVPLDIQLIAHRYIHRSLFSNVLHELKRITIDLQDIDYSLHNINNHNIHKCFNCKSIWTCSLTYSWFKCCFKCFYVL